MKRLVGTLILMGVVSLAARPCMAEAVPGLGVADDSALVYDPHGARDPFLPLVTSAGAIITYDANVVVAEMSLEGIVADGAGRVAIVNGNVVESGQMLGLYKVDRIEADCVILLKDGQTSILQLKKEE